MHTLADSVVLLAKGNQLGELVLEDAVSIAKLRHLPFRNRDRAPFMRVGNPDFCKNVDVSIEKLRMLLKILRNVCVSHFSP